jgi:hypothetical protein
VSEPRPTWRDVERVQADRAALYEELQSLKRRLLIGARVLEEKGHPHLAEVLRELAR